MISNWKTFTGISDDSFLGREWEFYDCNNIDVLDNSRYVDWAKHPDLTEIGSSIGDDITACKDATTYPVFASGTGTYLWFWWYNSSTSDWGQLGAYLVEQIGTASLPVTYWFKNWYIRQQTYNGATTPFNSVITTNVPSWVPTASCVGAWRIYFAVSNVIYILDTAITDPTAALSQVSATPANNKIPYGYTVKYMYIYMDIINVFATNWKSTTIYQLTEETTDVWEIRYYHTKNSVVIWAAWEWNNIFWFSKNSIYQSNGTSSEKVKVYGKYEMAETFTPNAICTIYDWIFKIADGTQLYEYGHKKPWYGSVLIRKTRARQLTAIDWALEVSYSGSNVWWWCDDYTVFAPLYQDWAITSLPYEWGNFNQKKESTAIRIWHVLPAYSTYSSTSTLASITVQVITDEMDQKWITTPVTVATITTPATWVAERYTDISMNEISQAIDTAWYNPDFHYLRMIVNWLRGDLRNTYTTWSNLWRKTPKFFGIELVHKDIKLWIPT